MMQHKFEKKNDRIYLDELKAMMVTCSHSLVGPASSYD